MSFLRLQPICCLSIGSRNLLQFKTRKISTTARNELKIRQGKVSASTEQKLRRTDELPANYQLIYRAPVENYMKWSKNVSSVSAGVIAALAGYKWIFDSNILPLTTGINIGGLVSNESDIWWFAGGFVLINLAVRVFVAIIPLRIYRNEDKYLAVYDSQLPFRTTKHRFNRGDVGTVEQYFNPWSDCMFRLGSRTSLLLIDNFKTPSDLSQMLGLK